MQPNVSIIIPVHNEQDNIRDLAKEVSTVMAKTPWRWECIWVDDASTDETPVVLKEIAQREPQHRFLRLDQQATQAGALATGFKIAEADHFVTMDGDGQNDPADIPFLVSCLLATGVDMVNGIRADRQDNFRRMIFSVAGNRFRNWLVGESLIDIGCAMRAFHRACVAGFPSTVGMHRYITTHARLNQRRRMLQISVNHRPRRAGSSKYNIFNRLDTISNGYKMKAALDAKGIGPSSYSRPLSERRAAARTVMPLMLDIAQLRALAFSLN